MKRFRALLASCTLAAFLFLAFLASAQAAIVHAGPSATGNGSGSDWINMASFNTLSLVRGNTYYVADGNYGSRTFNTPVSGSTLITIKKAIAADHGTDTGWNSALGDGVATWGSEVTFLTSNWVFDGATRTSTTSGHGFKIQWAGGSGDRFLNFGQAFNTQVSNITVRFLEIQGSNTEDDSVLDRGIGVHCGNPCTGSSNITLHKVYVHDTGNVLIHAFKTQTFLVEFSWFENNGSTPVNHGEGIVVTEGVNNFTFRYNVMTRIEGTAFITTPTSGHPGCSGTNQSNWYIYGNVFTRPQGNTDATGNGLIYVFDANHTGDFFVYNNTIVNLDNAFIGGEAGIGGPGCIATMTARNNLFDGIPAGGMSAGQSGSMVVTHNAFFDSPNIVTGSNTYVTTGNPFVGWTSNNYHLTSSAASDMSTGFPLASPYNTDPDGVTRGTDGKWDRGAFEFGSGATGVPATINSLRIINP